jgi:hypothetical protein
MAKYAIVKKDGMPSPYFWSDKDGSAHTAKTVYKRTESGVKRMVGVHYDVKAKRMVKE